MTPADTAPRPASLHRLLVVDDVPINLEIASLMLEQLGFEVEQASGGAEAIDLCLRREPDAVLMDIDMPGIDGLETTRRLRRLQQMGRIASFPIIALTAAAETLVCWRDAGMNGFLNKPVSKNELGRAIHQQLGLMA